MRDLSLDDLMEVFSRIVTSLQSISANSHDTCLYYSSSLKHLFQSTILQLFFLRVKKFDRNFYVTYVILTSNRIPLSAINNKLHESMMIARKFYRVRPQQAQDVF